MLSKKAFACYRGSTPINTRYPSRERAWIKGLVSSPSSALCYLLNLVQVASLLFLETLNTSFDIAAAYIPLLSHFGKVHAHNIASYVS